LEWKENFEKELLKLDKNLKVYEILPLTDNDINDLIKEKSKPFWEFIDSNHLKFLLKNIMITLELVQNFEHYDKNSTYIDIYREIIEKSITKVGEDREEKNTNRSLEDLIFIASSLATYMTLNKKLSISSFDLNTLASECYKVEDKSLIADDLKAILNTALFEKKENDFSFFHKSIQEYLTAYFINLKKLNTSTIKQIFAHDMGFYEEFEEVIIYLTNIEPDFFKYFIEFDPFIFRRHPYLSQDNQKALFISMLNTLENNEQKGSTKWVYIENSTLVKFPLVSKKILIDILNNSLNEKKVNYVLWVYLVSLLEYNHSIELENILFRILDNIDSRKQCFNYIEAHHINNFSFNQKLLRYIIENNYIANDESSLYRHLFHVLYKKQNFNELIVLLNHLSIADIEGNLMVQDLLYWFDKVHSQSDNSHINNRLAFILLKRYKQLQNKDILKKIFSYLNSSDSFRFDIQDYNLNTLLHFHDIKNEFWNYYFNLTHESLYRCNLLSILNLYNISILDITDITTTYPIGNHIEHYMYFRNHSKCNVHAIDNILTKNLKFKAYMNEILEQKKRSSEERANKYKKQEIKREKEEQDRLSNYENALSTLKTKKDLITIYSFFYNHDNLHEKLVTNLKDKYPIFIELIKKEFDNDTSYLQIKNTIIENNIFYTNLIFCYYFSTLSNRQLETLRLSKKEYEKLFWHTVKLNNQNLMDEYFITISKSHIEWCRELLVELMNSAFQLSNHTSILDWFYHYIPFFKKLEIYNPKDLKIVIENSKHLIVHSFQKLERDKNTVIEIIAVDKNNYEFILELLLNDKEHYINYFESLLSIDINRAIKDFSTIYYPQDKEDYISFSTNNNAHFLTPVCKLSEYDILNINPIKRKYFKEIIGTLSDMHRYKNFNFLSDLSNEHIAFILRSYFNFFKPFSYPKDGYTDNVYENMHRFINKLITSLGEDTKYIEFLNKLIFTSKGKLQTHCKRQLENLYNLQLQTRDFDNKYYANIFNDYQSSENRFFDYTKLKKDLIEIALLETENRKKTCYESEDETIMSPIVKTT